jgi:hypothetical protein
MRKHEMRGRETRALLARARVLLATDGVSGATRIRRDLDDALALCDRNGMPAWEPLIREEAARLHALCGESHRAAQEQRAALELYTKLGAIGHAARLRGGAGIVTCRQCGHQPPAGSTFCNGCGAKLVKRVTSPKHTRPNSGER